MFGLEKLGSLGGGANDAPPVIASKEEIEARRKLARALAQQGSDTSPVQHWTQGAARIAQALNGAIVDYQADKADAAAQADWDKERSEKLAPLIGAMLGKSSSDTAAPSAQPSASLAAPGNIPPVREGDISKPFLDTLRSGGITNPNALAAIGATGARESGWSGAKAGQTWADPSESGQAGTSGGALSWRADRLKALQDFARANGEQGNGSPQTQAKFFMQEDPQLIARLNATKTPEEAMQHMNNAWRFAGYDRQSKERDARMAEASAWAGKVASNDPAFMPQRAPVVPQAAQEGQQQPSAPVQVAQTTQQGTTNGAPSLAKLLALTSSRSYDRASPGDKKVIEALIQRQVLQETKDPLDTALKQEQLTKARRDNSAVEMDRVQDPATGAYYERQKGATGAWKRVEGLGEKPAETTGDQRELDQINRERSAAGQPTLRLDEWKLQKGKANATNITNDLTGGTSKQVFDTLKDRAEAAQTAATGLAALQEARKAVEAGGFFGAGADARLGFAKLGQALGYEDGRITNTETFRSAIAPQVAAVMKATVGSTQISNADREFAEKAAGGSIALDPKSITRLLNIMERGSNAIIERHRSTLDKVYPDTPDGKFARERALFGVDVPQKPTDGWRDVGGGVRMRERAAQAPTAGDVLDGYRFKGGNPADKSNWERVQ